MSKSVLSCDGKHKCVADLVRDEQEIARVREKWMSIGLSTEPVDRSAAEACLPALYGT
jgi:hypothetical protein